MATLITREVGPTAKNDVLTNAELDQNFINLNDAIVAAEASIELVSSEQALVMAIALG